MLKVNQMATYNVKGVACSNEPTENYNLSLQFLLSPTKHFSVFSSLIWFYSNLLFSFNQISPINDSTLKN